MMRVLDKVTTVHVAYQLMMAAIVKRTATMEIRQQKHTLQKTTFRLCYLLGLAHIVAHNVTQDLKGVQCDNKLTQLQLSSKTFMTS